MRTLNLSQVNRLLVLFLVTSLYVEKGTGQSSILGSFNDSLAYHSIIGGSITLIDQEITYTKHVGYSNIEDSIKINDKTIYHWASNTKTFTAIAIMQLVERGLLRLDDPITQYLPEIKLMHSDFGSVEQITISSLLSHSSGIRRGTWIWAKYEEWEPYEPTEWAQIKAMLPYSKLRFKPNSKYGYSNPGYILLGKVIEIITDMPYETYVDKNILKPLGMYDSYFDAVPYHLVSNKSKAYYYETVKDSLYHFNKEFNTGITVANGGLNASFEDMTKYLHFLMRNNDKNTVYEGILSYESFMKMLEPRFLISKEQEYEQHIGLGFFIQKFDNGDVLYGHGGYQFSFDSDLTFSTKIQKAFLSCMNTYVYFEKEGRYTSPSLELSKKLNQLLWKNWFMVD